MIKYNTIISLYHCILIQLSYIRQPIIYKAVIKSETNSPK